MDEEQNNDKSIDEMEMKDEEEKNSLEESFLQRSKIKWMKDLYPLNILNPHWNFHQ